MELAYGGEGVKVPIKRYMPCDLEQRINVCRKFDLVISLEVAEHLSEKRASSFIEELTHLGDVILFGAAVPYQGGDHHINEQPITYWIDLFEKNGFIALDIIRPRVQYDKKIWWWYRQNTLIYVKKDSLIYSDFDQYKNNIPLNMVCYELYLEKVEMSLKWKRICENVIVKAMKKVHHFIKNNNKN